MKRQFKIFLLTSLLCLLAMLLMLSVSAAYETGGRSYASLKEAVAAVANGGTITATGNTTESSAVTLDKSKSYTIDAQGYTVTFGGSEGLKVTAGTVTIAGGTFKGGTDCNIIYLNGKATVNITGGKFVGGRSQVNLTNQKGGTVTISGDAQFGYGTDNVTRAIINSNNGAFNADLTAKSEDTIIIEGGTFTGKKGSSHGLINAAGCNVTVKGGTFTMPMNATAPLIRMADGDNISDVRIEGGTFTHSGTGAIVLYGGGN